jgi:hypothetical protein
MHHNIPEKAKLLCHLKHAGFIVPDFIYVPAEDFENKNFDVLEKFLQNHRESFKVIVRSAHPQEYYFKGGTFDSVTTYADLAGVIYARNRIIKLARTTKSLSIRRQQAFDDAPEVDLDQMGIIVMPFLDGSCVMAKKLWDHWEFGYCRDRTHKVQREPYITCTPDDRRLLEVSEKIQDSLEFQCEIEYIITNENEIYVVQAKDISKIEVLDKRESERSISLDGVRRIRKRRNYRERPVFVMDSKSFYIKLLSICEEIHQKEDLKEPPPTIDDLLDCIGSYQKELEDFALRHQRFAIMGLSIHAPEELYQQANHSFDDEPEIQTRLSEALRENLYKVDTFIAEADTLIAKDKYRIKLCGHDAYGIDTVRNPIWTVYWSMARHDRVVKELIKIGFKTGDSIGIDIDDNCKPTVYRL